MLRRPMRANAGAAVGLALLVATLLWTSPEAPRAQAKELRIGAAGFFAKHMRAQGLEAVPVRIVNFTGGPQIH
jgi:hypothetical protein